LPIWLTLCNDYRAGVRSLLIDKMEKAEWNWISGIVNSVSSNSRVLDQIDSPTDLKILIGRDNQGPIE
jgi:hypothetical protein